ncbi:hypothetical protein [Sphingopyxis sp. YR583]|nr:hypothetical protein [Sphingopyxis sp. YR583]
MKKRRSALRDSALAIEYWIATVVVGGAFLAGLREALIFLLGGN